MTSITLLTSHNYFPALRDAILSAQSSIDILLYQFNRYVGNSNSKITQLTYALLKAHQKGVPIRLILNAAFSSKSASAVNQSTVDFFRKQGIPARLGPKNLRIHAKVFVIDHSLVILGSHNLSERAVTKNIEFSLLINSPSLASSLTISFDEIWKTP